MAILEIKTDGAEVLRQIAGEVTAFDPTLWRLLDDMKDTMYKLQGVGIAAPQVGVSLRAIVLDCEDEKRGLMELINPVITRTWGECTDSEGCLSVPDWYGKVKRAERITCEYYNRRGKKQRITTTGLLGRCIQHEIDHLNGILFTDTATDLEKREKK